MTAALRRPVPTVWPMSQPPVENQLTGMSRASSSCSVGVDSETGPNSASSETSIIGTSVLPSSVSITSISPDFLTRAPDVLT